MSDTAEIVELKRIRPVKWSRIDRAVGPYRLGYVKAFLKYEGSPLLEEDGQPIVDGKGNPREVTASSFASHFGIEGSTFRRWVFDIRGMSPHPNARVGGGRKNASALIVGADDEEVFAPRVVGSQPDAGAKGANGSVGADTLLEHHGQCSHCPDFPEGG
jgi:hypothetical protein